MSVKYQDYYKTLGVSRDASQDEIQKAFRKLARKYHPDVSKEKNAEDEFKKINEAYEVLKNPETRKRYDALGAGWKAGDQFTPPPGFDFGNMHFDFGGANAQAGGFSSFFDSIFGDAFGGGFGGHSSYARRKGPDEQADLTVHVEDLVSEQAKQIRLGDKQLKVKIPKGAAEGTRIRLKGQAERRGPYEPGDLFLTIKIAPHPYFQVQGHNLLTKLFIAPWEAALGAKVPVRTLDKAVTLTIAPGSQSGTKLKLRGKGLPTKDGHGDLLVELQIQVPKTLTPEEKELFEKLAQTSHFSPRGD